MPSVESANTYIDLESIEPSGSMIHNRFTVIIPAYNEISRIKPVMNEIVSFVEDNDLNWKVIVSIDGNDGTYDLIKDMSLKHSFILPLKGNGRDGKGNGVKRAVTIADGDYIILMDADGSISLNDIVNALDIFGNNDAIMFDRYRHPENVIPLGRRISSRGFNKLLRGIIGIKINDTQCGYKVIKTEEAKRIFNRISVTNTFFDVAFSYYLKEHKLKVAEIPVKYHHSSGSKFNVISEVIGQGISLVAFRIRKSPLYKYIPEKLKVLYYKKFRWI
ncbi:MAG: glycosyltransferase [Thermoplasmataceae archaeon]